MPSKLNAVEIRITRLAPNHYELCILRGFLDTTTIQMKFDSYALALAWIKSKYDISGIPVIRG
jgi:hypothetical protein